MFIFWIEWLALVYEFSPPIADLLSQLINFVFTNTHQGSLNEAERWVKQAKSSFPQINIPTTFLVMDKHLGQSQRRGIGAKNLREGEDAIHAWLECEFQKELISQSLFYIPIGTVGPGNTGTASLIPATEAAHADPNCWTIPLALLSTLKEMKVERQEEQQNRIRHLLKLPLWVMLADNGYFTTPTNIWNRAFPLQESYKRIDYLNITALRSLFFMIIHRLQIDESKLEGSLFAGPGGTLCIGAVDLDLRRSAKKETKRAAQFLFDTPYRLEYYSQLGETLPPDQQAKFDSIVIGTFGGIKAVDEPIITENIQKHEYVQKYLPDAEMYFHRFGSYLDERCVSIFAMPVRKRPGNPIALRYPPADHPLVAALCELEYESGRSLSKVVDLGRGEDSPIEREWNDSIPVPITPLSIDIERVDPSEDKSPAPTFQSEHLIPIYTSCAQFLERDPDRLMHLLQAGLYTQIPLDGFNDTIRLMEFINERMAAIKDFKPDSMYQYWLRDKLKDFGEAMISSKGMIRGVSYCSTEPLTKLESLASTTDIHKPLEEMDAELRHFKLSYIYRKVLGDAAMALITQ